MTRILVINSGSSSLKFSVLDLPENRMVVSGSIDRIGETVHNAAQEVGASPSGSMSDHTAATASMFANLREHNVHGVEAVGHRVVHGGSVFAEPTLITDDVLDVIRELSTLAPLHNPANVAGIEAARAELPNIPHVAVFDTAFHQSMPSSAYTYAIDRRVAIEFGIRRYGFHGTSHASAARLAAQFLGRPLTALSQVIMHLGNGASMTAVCGGESRDTSMGMTPLEGLVMGSRSGDIDPGAMLYLLRDGNYSAESLDTLLNADSGLLGLSGFRDMRDVLAEERSGNADATLALEVYIHRIRHYLGAYLLELGGADVIVFTAGVGENEPLIRERVLAGCAWFGVELDPERNSGARVDGAHRVARISSDASDVEVLVIAADEELEIAEQTLKIITSD